MGEKSSVQLSVGMVSRTFDTSIGTFTSEQKDAGFIVIPEYRYYFNEALQGLYAGAFFRYRGVTTTNTVGESGDLSETEWKRTAVGGGALLGYQFILGERVALDLFAGPQFKSASSELSSGEIDVNDIISFEGESDGLGARFGLNVGVTF